MSSDGKKDDYPAKITLLVQFPIDMGLFFIFKPPNEYEMMHERCVACGKTGYRAFVCREQPVCKACFARACKEEESCAARGWKAVLYGTCVNDLCI
jgi:hypothetical protein